MVARERPLPRALVVLDESARALEGLSHKSSDETRYAIEGYMEQAAIDGIDGKREVSLIFDHWLDEQKRIGGYVLKGFSDASPDWGMGVVLKYSL